MIINSDYSGTDLLNSIQTGSIDDKGEKGSFAGLLQEQVTIAQEMRSGLKTGPDNENKDDIAVIKEKGLVAYILEQHAKRIREKILEAMGLTEEDLAKLPPEQRAVIEKIIAEETQKQMAAESIVKKGDKKTVDRNQLDTIFFGGSKL